jgi:hypothetical protein
MFTQGGAEYHLLHAIPRLWVTAGYQFNVNTNGRFWRCLSGLMLYLRLELFRPVFRGTYVWLLDADGIEY